MSKIRNLKELRPELFDGTSKIRYSYDKNDGVNPEKLELANSEELWFIGTTCNHEFKTTLGNILRKDRENKCPYCEGRRILIGFNDLKTKYPEFFNGENKIQWNEKKNKDEGVLLDNISEGSLKPSWFICKNGHEWKANTHNVFVLGKGCPYCGGKKSIIGKNDLTITHPEIAKEWNCERNIKKPEDYKAGSNKKVWWRTEAERYGKIWILEWEDRIDTRTIQNAGCPYLTNKKVLKGFNDFETWCIHNNRKDLLEEWDYEKNGDLKPEDCLDGGTKYVWWKKLLFKDDKVFEASWKALIRHRKLGIGDPYSSIPARTVLKGYNDLASCYPEIAKEWNYDKNDELKPDEVLTQSNKKVWWKCNNCGNEWETTISNRTGIKNNCPYCCNLPKKIKPGFNDFVTYAKNNDNELLEYIDNKKNKEDGIDVQTLGFRSNKKVNLICPDCNHQWKGSLDHLVRGARCPKCNASKGEKKIEKFLANNKISHLSEYSFDDCRYELKLRFDFAIFDDKNILVCLIEYDGIVHDKAIDFGCKDKDKVKKEFEIARIRDNIKNEYCKKNKIPLIRIHYTKFNEIENILEQKFKELGLMS